MLRRRAVVKPFNRPVQVAAGVIGPRHSPMTALARILMRQV
jgi:hypothetical protein